QVLARAVKVVGVENVYPKKIGQTYPGDAHWACLPHTPVYSQVNVLKTVQNIASMALDGQIGDTVALLGGRFVSWAIAIKLDGVVDNIIISDIDPWVEHVTIDNPRSELQSDKIPANSSNSYAHKMQKRQLYALLFQGL
uniref:FeGP cofactor biosynthesis family protein n=1 Tax=Methanospirillum sp. TaxID=45200 RepID=UPI001BD246EA